MIMLMSLTRFKRFIGHYKKMRESEINRIDDPLSFVEFIFSQYPLGMRHSRSMWNCIVWAWANSKTHNVDGTYL